MNEQELKALLDQVSAQVKAELKALKMCKAKSGQQYDSVTAGYYNAVIKELKKKK